ncbi:MAG TPA: hypothetical protein QGF58_24630 [Myxococcota bacterium]|nr:hypothetical protein [Myxococcota bacterium]
MLVLFLACTDYELTPDGDVKPGEEEEDVFGQIEVEPEALDFGDVLIGDSRSSVATITNVGEGELVLDEPVLSEGSVTLDCGWHHVQVILYNGPSHYQVDLDPIPSDVFPRVRSAL